MKDRTDTHLLKLMYKRSRDERYLDGNDLIRTQRRDAPILWVPFPNIEITKKSAIYKGSELWNQPSPETRNTPTYEAYKELLKTENRLKLTKFQSFYTEKDYKCIVKSLERHKKTTTGSKFSPARLYQTSV